MSETVLVGFLVLAAAGALVQAITGFAMGLIIMGAVTVLGLADIGFSAAVVSLISMVNTAIALRLSHHHVHRRLFPALVGGLLPATVVGVAVLHFMSTAYVEALRLLLGLVIIVAGSVLMLRPTPFTAVSPLSLVAGMGAVGGVVGGMYGAGGAPLAWLMYRQPIAFEAIRATLLATFFMSTAGRTVVVVASGQMTADILWTACLSVPLVVVFTLIGARLSTRLPEPIVRRIVFGVLVMLGCVLIWQSLAGMAGSRGR